MTPPAVLSFSASDSAGGAGVQADLNTYAALGVHGATAITGLTAQNTTDIRGMFPTPPSFVIAQAEAVLDDLAIAATKTGMLPTAAIARRIADLGEQGRLPNLVVDPVLVSSSGHPIFGPETVKIFTDRLFPLARVITPNLDEAALLIGTPITTLADLEAAAVQIHHFGSETVVVKGGRLKDQPAVDVVFDGKQMTRLSTPRVETLNDHGTGCSFAAATAAGLAHGLEPSVAIEQAKAFVDVGIRSASSWRLGAGHGPIDHLAWRTQQSR